MPVVAKVKQVQMSVISEKPSTPNTHQQSLHFVKGEEGGEGDAGEDLEGSTDTGAIVPSGEVERPTCV